MSINIFGSSWEVPETDNFDAKEKKSIVLVPEMNFKNKSYPFGIDPIWMISENKIPFTNSFKMKMAVILGLMQMTFGTVLGVWNHTYFKDRTGFPPPRSVLERTLRRTLNIWAQFIPEIIFLLSLFGYLVFMIIYKWMLPLGAPYGQRACCSRSILILFINMFMPAPQQFDDKGHPKPPPCYQQQLYDGQAGVQMVILLLALVSAPWLLCAKPLYLFYLSRVHARPLPPDFVPIVSEEEVAGVDETDAEEERRSQASSASSSRRKKSTVSLHTIKGAEHLVDLDDDIDSAPQVSNSHAVGHSDGHGEEHHFELGEVAIHQIIHTIEFCLGAVSNTASYLRLWALSLAHSQLSEVLWSMVFKGAIFGGGDTIVQQAITAVMIYLTWFGWAILTVCILLIMEGLSAFLHALRLHWVEFMNKFFKGEGYLFAPFNFKEVVRSIDE